MSRKTVHVVPASQGGHVVPASQGGWNVKSGGADRAAAHFDLKVDATERRRSISQNQRAELLIHNRNGRFAQSDSHGADPFPPKG
ncbi:MAG: DUF2188 domain-containing protein [Verrucomicrobia bacterium]|nr:DUF2188 domain-containing protein [Verrucomicrobiota bacterium]